MKMKGINTFKIYNTRKDEVNITQFKKNERKMNLQKYISIKNTYLYFLIQKNLFSGKI